MNNYCTLENLDISFNSSTNTDISMTAILFNNITSKTSHVNNCNINVNNATVNSTSKSDVTGIMFSGTKSITDISAITFTSIENSNINIYSNGNGTKRGILVDGSNGTYIKNVNVFIDKPINGTSTGSYVGIETNDPTELGTIQIRNSAINAITPVNGETFTASDILQTTPTIINNIGYLISPGIQLGPGTDLMNKTAGNKGFFMHSYPTIIYYGLKGDIKSGSTNAYLWPGTMAVTNNVFPDPSNNKPAYFRIQQNCLIMGIMATLSLPPGNTHNITLTIKYTPVGGVLTDTNFILSFTGTDLIKNLYDSSLRLNSGDLIHLYITYTGGNGNGGHDLTCQIDLF
jgi:hypothetical protein